MEEVKQVVWDCDGSKALGPDGYKVWDLISSNIKRPDHAPSLQLIFLVYRVHEAEEISFKTG
jgi:hypothetical protein